MSTFSENALASLTFEVGNPIPLEAKYISKDRVNDSDVKRTAELVLDGTIRYHATS